MKHAALPLTLLAAFFFFAVSGCRSIEAGPVVPDGPSNATSAAATSSTQPTYAPSPNRIIGYILDIDEAQGLAIIDLTAHPLPPELHDGVELTVRTRDLRKTARLRASRIIRGRTLGATIVTGLPAVGEEVVLAARP